MKKAGVAILGLGVVGGGTYQIITKKREFLLLKSTSFNLKN